MIDSLLSHACNHLSSTPNNWSSDLQLVSSEVRQFHDNSFPGEHMKVFHITEHRYHAVRMIWDEEQFDLCFTLSLTNPSLLIYTFNSPLHRVIDMSILGLQPALKSWARLLCPGLRTVLWGTSTHDLYEHGKLLCKG